VLTFVGNSSLLDELLERPGLERPQVSVAEPKNTTLPLFEAVISPSSRLVGRSLYETAFRDTYQGIVLGIQRRDAAIDGPLGRIPLQAGDLLLIEAQEGFDRRWNENREEFYLVAPRRPEKAKSRQKKAPVALAILIAVVVLAAFDLASIVTTAFIGALAMIVTRCLDGRAARRSVDLPVLLVIAAALGLGKAIETTGLASALAQIVTAQVSILGAVGVVAVVYIATSLLTEMITNNAAAALMLGVGLAASQELGVPHQAFASAVAIGASASFLTPIGYQTNLMVLAAGGYRFADFVRTGFLVNLIVGGIAILMIWLVWL
jgi:di/tricarboxylate transporter